MFLRLFKFTIILTLVAFPGLCLGSLKMGNTIFSLSFTSVTTHESRTFHKDFVVKMAFALKQNTYSRFEKSSSVACPLPVFSLSFFSHLFVSLICNPFLAPGNSKFLLLKNVQQSSSLIVSSLIMRLCAFPSIIKEAIREKTNFS